MCYSRSSEFETPTEGEDDGDDFTNVVPSADAFDVYKQVDTFLEGGDAEKVQAYDLLQNNKTKVSYLLESS